MKPAVERGEYLLEFALVIPILLLVVLGALDANNLLSANSALNEGVKLAARCLYATDGNCVDATGNAAALYDVSLIKSTPVIFGDMFDYSGQGSWLQLQAQHYEPIRAKVLDQVHVNVQEQQGNTARALYPAQSLHDYNVRILDFPYIIPKGSPAPGNSKSESDLGFVYGATGTARNTSYPPNETVNLKTVKLRTTASAGSRASAGVNFTISSPSGLDLNLPCYISSQLDAPVGINFPHVAKAGLPLCGDNWPFSKNIKTTANNELSVNTYVTIWVTGDVSGTQVGASGGVSLSIENLNSGKVVADLGGKLIDTSDTGNFIPRGNPLARIDPTLKNEPSLNGGGPYPEWTSYEATRLPLNTPLRAVFTLTNNNSGAISEWNGATMFLYAPQYQFAQARPENCGTSLPDSDISKKIGCSDRFPANSPTRKSLIKTSSNPNAFDNQMPLGCQLDQSSAQVASDSAVATRNKSLGLLGTANELMPGDFQISLTAAPGCPITSVSSSCPPNFGVATPADNFGHISNPVPADSICPSSPGNGRQIVNTYWTEAVQDTTPRAFDSIPSDCTDATLHSPAWLSNYAKLEPLPGPVAGPAFPVFPYSPDQNPNIGLSDPRYSCATLATEDFNNLADWLPTTSLFRGARADLGCPWADLLKADAVQNGLDARAYFEPAKVNVGQTELTGTADSCMSTHFGQGTLQAPIYLGQFPAGQPADCTLPNQECTYSFVGFDGNQGNSNLDSAKALQLALQEVQAAYPQAVANCVGDHCLNLSLTNTNGELNVVGSLRVPVKLFLGTSVTLQRNVVKTLEANFVR